MSSVQALLLTFSGAELLNPCVFSYSIRMFESPFAFALLLCGVGYGRKGRAYLERYNQWLDRARHSLSAEELEQRKAAAELAAETLTLSPKLLPPAMDVRGSYMPHVPHRSPREQHVLASRTHRQIPLDSLIGEIVSPRHVSEVVASYRYPDVTAFLRSCSESGHWLAALRVSNEREALRALSSAVVTPLVNSGRSRYSDRVNSAISHVSVAQELAARRRMTATEDNEHASSDDIGYTIKALIQANKKPELVRYFARYREVPLNPGVYAALLDFFAHDRRGSISVITALRDCGVEFLESANEDEAALMRAYLRTVAHFDWIEALRFYQFDLCNNIKEQAASEGRMRFSTPSTVGKSPLQADAYCALFKGVARGSPYPVAEGLYFDILRRAPKDVPEILLAGLTTASGLRLAFDYLAPSKLTPQRSIQSEWEIAFHLLDQCPTPVRVQHATSAILTLAPHRWRGILERLDSLGSRGGTQQEWLIALRGPVLVHQQWQLALTLAQRQLALKSHFAHVPALIGVVAARGPTHNNQRWHLALQLCTRLFTMRHTSPSTDELSLSVHASVHCAKWSSALFWIERAHAKGMRFSSQTYDAAFVGCAYVNQWESTLRVLSGMAKVNGSCTEVGLRSVFESTVGSTDERSAAVLQILDTESATWVE